MKIKSFISDGLSVSECKVSALIIITIVVAIFSLVECVMLGDVPNNLVLMFQTLVAAVTGINITNAISEKFNKGE